MTTKIPMEVQSALATRISDALASSFCSAGQGTWTSALASTPQPVLADGEHLFAEVALEGTLQGSVFIDLPRVRALSVAEMLTQASEGEGGVDPSEALLQHILSAANEVAAKTTQEQTSFTIGSVQWIDVMDASIARESGVAVELRSDTEEALTVTLHFNSALMESLAVGTDVTAVQSSLEATAAPVREAMNLDLVLDVELNVTLRFGQRILTLREILDLTSGSVVELDRQVEEPVELLLEGKVIARGEAVVIDGNYGLRVTEVPQPISAQLLS
jgi:flagellar motor switch protein FliN/FliY